MIKKFLKNNNKKVFIIAEAGVNHNGNISNAYKLIDIAKKCGADAVKFQTWKKGEITGKYTDKVDYIKKNLKKNNLSRYNISEKLRLTYNDFIKLKKYADKKEIIFLTTPDGEESLKFCINTLNIAAIKIGSSELNNYDFLKEISMCNRDVILSTGMGSFKEISKAINIFKKNLNKKKDLYILQCTSEYPTPLESVNLNAMIEIKKKYKFQVGLSDHSEGNIASLLACANDAKIIEKHFTINKNMKGPDHKASLDPNELYNFISDIRKIPIVMGNKVKKPTLNELKNLPNVRRGVVAKKKD